MLALNSCPGCVVTARATHATFHIAYIASVLSIRAARFIVGAIGQVITTASSTAAPAAQSFSEKGMRGRPEGPGADDRMSGTRSAFYPRLEHP